MRNLPVFFDAGDIDETLLNVETIEAFCPVPEHTGTRIIDELGLEGGLEDATRLVAVFRSGSDSPMFLRYITEEDQRATLKRFRRVVLNRDSPSACFDDPA